MKKWNLYCLILFEIENLKQKKMFKKVEVYFVMYLGLMMAYFGIESDIATYKKDLDNALDNVLTVRASAGAKLNELDVVDAVGSNRMLNYEQTLSDLVDLDYADAISEYSLRQVGLQASQKAFVDIKGMSLFDFM